MQQKKILANGMFLQIFKLVKFYLLGSMYEKYV